MRSNRLFFLIMIILSGILFFAAQQLGSELLQLNADNRSKNTKIPYGETEPGSQMGKVTDKNHSFYFYTISTPVVRLFFSWFWTCMWFNKF